MRRELRKLHLVRLDKGGIMPKLLTETKHFQAASQIRELVNTLSPGEVLAGSERIDGDAEYFARDPRCGR